MLRASQDHGFFAMPRTAPKRRIARYDQKMFLRKLNQYFVAAGNSPIDESGYCHGLSLLWLKRMTKSREEDFYAFIRMIIDSPIKDLMEHNAAIEKFVKSIDKKQNPRLYSDNVFTYKDVNVLLKIKTQEVLDQTCISKDLAELFELARLDGMMFCLSNRKAYVLEGVARKHTVAVYVRNSMFYLYDANYLHGNATVFSTAIELVREIRVCLYSCHQMRPPSYMPLEIKLLHESNMLQQATMTDLLTSLWQTISSKLTTLNSYMPTFSLFYNSTQRDEMDLEAGNCVAYTPDQSMQILGRT